MYGFRVQAGLLAVKLGALLVVGSTAVSHDVCYAACNMTRTVQHTEQAECNTKARVQHLRTLHPVNC